MPQWRISNLCVKVSESWKENGAYTRNLPQAAEKHPHAFRIEEAIVCWIWTTCNAISEIRFGYSAALAR